MFAAVHNLLEPALPLIGVLLLMSACWTDLATRRIANCVVLAVLFDGLVLHALRGDLISASLAAGAVFVISVVVWQQGWLGGGDAKLLPAATLLMAPDQTILFVALTSLVGGVMALAIIALRPMALALPQFALQGRHSRTVTLARMWNVELWRLRHGGSLPYALAITGGAVLVLWLGGAEQIR